MERRGSYALARHRGNGVGDDRGQAVFPTFGHYLVVGYKAVLGEVLEEELNKVLH